MKLINVRKDFINDITVKYKNQYFINLNSWSPNPITH